MSLPPHPRSNKEARTALARFFRNHAETLNDDGIPTFFVAIGEALANAIEHSETTGMIDVTARILDHFAVVSVHDSGHGFVMSGIALPPPESERGRGLPLMRLCSDALEISSAPGCGTTVVLAHALLSASR